MAASTLTLPPGLATGSYYIAAQADADAVVPETAETNNVLAVSVRVGPDVSSLSKPTSVPAGAVVTLTDTTKNQGRATLNPSTTYLGAVTIPAGLAPGTYYIMVKADGDSTVEESLETNNLLAIAITVKN